MCDVEAIGAPSILRVILKSASLAKMLPTFDLSCVVFDFVARWKEGFMSMLNRTFARL